MNRMRFNAFLKEFPFLQECNTRWGGRQRDPISCDGIKVARISKELLAYTPRYEGATGSQVDIDNGERVDFIFSDGQILRNAVRSFGFITHNEPYTENEDLGGETVLEAIERHNAADDLEFIVRVNYGYNIRGHYSLANYSMTIYKMAKDFTLNDIIANEEALALAQVRAEANF